MQAAERRRWLWILARILEMISLFLVKPRLQEQVRGICQGLSFRCNVGRWQTGRKRRTRQVKYALGPRRSLIWKGSLI